MRKSNTPSKKTLFKRKFDFNLWDRIENLSSDLKFQFAKMHTMNASVLEKIKKANGNERNNYSIEMKWNQLLSMFILKNKPIIPKSTISRFLSFLMSQPETIQTIWENQLRKLLYLRPFLGKVLVLKNLKFKNGDESLLLLDGITAIPLALEEKISDPFAAAFRILVKFKDTLPQHLYRDRYLVADFRYDNASFLKDLWDVFHIKPVISIKDEKNKNPVYKGINCNSNYELCCRNGFYLIFNGFEEKRNTLKYACPAKKYDIHCPNKSTCSFTKGIRIPLDANRRIFTPIPRGSCKWQQIYDLNQSKEMVQKQFKYLMQNCKIRKEKASLFFRLACLIISSYAIGVQSQTSNCDRPI